MPDQETTLSQSLSELLGQVALSQAADLARAGNYLQAEALLADLLHEPEPPVAAIDLLARIRAQQGRLGEAEVLWRQALARDPGNETIHRALARVARLQQRRWPIVRPGAVATALSVVLLLAMTGLLRRVAGLQGDLAHISQAVAALQVPTPLPTASPEPTLPPLAEVVRQALQADPELSSLEIHVSQEEHSVRLEGTVPSVEIKAWVEAVARRVSGVALVDSTALRVSPPALTGAVQNALAADPRTSVLMLTVEQVEHGVRLLGRAPSLEALRAAEEIALAVEGVRWVDATAVQVETPAFLYTVRPGDSLVGIARLFYGDPNAWACILDANREVIGADEIIHPGMRLRIPLLAGSDPTPLSDQ